MPGINCPHWSDNGDPKAGLCAKAYYGPTPTRRICHVVCKLNTILPGSAIRSGAVVSPQQTAPAHGVGAELKRILSSLGITDSIGCGCAKLAAQMDTNGPDWCEANLDMIVAKMEATANARNWLRFVPFKQLGARLLVERAITEARKTL